jgi:hypothetical protein
VVCAGAARRIREGPDRGNACRPSSIEPLDRSQLPAQENFVRADFHILWRKGQALACGISFATGNPSRILNGLRRWFRSLLRSEVKAIMADDEQPKLP